MGAPSPLLPPCNTLTDEQTTGPQINALKAAGLSNHPPRIGQIVLSGIFR
jgi:hypothetical protein